MGAAARVLVAILVAVVAIAVVRSSNPSTERPDVALAIDATVAAVGNGGIVDLGTIVRIDWDTVYGFPGYTTDDEVTAAIGTTFGAHEEDRLPYDGLNLVVFVNDGSIAAWSILNKGEHAVAVRFDEDLYGRPVSRRDAIFVASTRERTVGGYDLYRLSLRPPGTLPLGVDNGTRLPVTVIVNGERVASVPPLTQRFVEPEALPAMPWKVEARSPTGRVLLTLDVVPGVVSQTNGPNGEATMRGAADCVDLSCGRLDLYAGPLLLGPPPGPGVPGDCEP